MAPRVELNALLAELAPHVYFQPPSNVKMEYPCIVYHRDREYVVYADDDPYRQVKRYQVTVIDPNPDSLIPDQVGRLPMCRHAAFFTKTDLNHDVYDLYF